MKYFFLIEESRSDGSYGGLVAEYEYDQTLYRFIRAMEEYLNKANPGSGSCFRTSIASRAQG